MRVPKLPSLVIATGCCISQAVKAEDVPTSIVVSATTVAENGTYTVSWESCTSPCEVLNFTLLELGIGSAQQSGTVAPGQDSVATMLDSPDPSGIYSVILLYVTDTALPITAQHTEGPPFSFASTASDSAASTNTASTSATSTISTSQDEANPVGSFPFPSTVKTGSEISSFSPTGHAPVSTPQSSGSNVAEPSAPILVSTTSTGGVLASGSSEPSGASGSTGLSTGAKVGIAIGVIGAALIVLIGAILVWRRRRIQQLRALPDGMPYSHDTGSTNRDLTAEKEMNVINSPVDTLHNGYSAVPNAPHTQSQSQTGSWAPQEERSIIGAAAAAVPYTDAQRRSYGSGYADSSPPGTDVQSTVPPTTASGTTIQRKPVGAMSGTTQHLREPGMSDEEVARLEEEERRLDEAIAEAERKRQLQG